MNLKVYIDQWLTLGMFGTRFILILQLFWRVLVVKYLHFDGFSFLQEPLIS